jgi:hypothetical protein
MPVTSEQLFQGVPLNLESDKAPLSPLQNYVIQELPTDLRRVRESDMTLGQLAHKQDKVLQAAQSDIIYNTDPEEAMFTQLDLTFMLGSYLPKGIDTFRHAPPSLHAALEQQRDRFKGAVPLRMDYELVIDANSAAYDKTGLTRVFTDGRVGADERDFYLGHSAAEVFAKDAAYKLHNLAKAPNMQDPSAVLNSAHAGLDTFKRFMGMYGKMPRENFETFRQYFSAYPDGVPNASGAFMPSPQLLEVALHAPTEGFNDYVKEALPYFPRWARPVFTEWRNLSETGINIEDRLATGALSLSVEEKKILSDVVEKFIGFRMAHLGVTYKQIPGAFNGNDMPKRKELKNFGEPPIFEAATEANKGSGGFDIRNLLGGTVYRLMQLKERLQQ